MEKEKGIEWACDGKGGAQPIDQEQNFKSERGVE